MRAHSFAEASRSNPQAGINHEGTRIYTNGPSGSPRSPTSSHLPALPGLPVQTLRLLSLFAANSHPWPPRGAEGANVDLTPAAAVCPFGLPCLMGRDRVFTLFLIDPTRRLRDLSRYVFGVCISSDLSAAVFARLDPSGILRANFSSRAWSASNVDRWKWKSQRLDEIGKLVAFWGTCFD